ncbi:MAG: Uma2 family endonuclease [Kofleriaceae bacterium]|nr:Uma2 family endonuclease [Kofleriaceae bacterium]
MPSAPTSKLRTFEELVQAMFDGREGYIREIVGGEIVETQRPGPPHVEASSHLGALLVGRFRFGNGGPGGWMILDEPAIRFGDDVRVPDLAGWRVERYVRPSDGVYLVVPDWICELLSPGTVRNDRTTKLPLYARHGVKHVWLLDAVAQTLEVYRLHDVGWYLAGTFGGDAKVRAEPFDAVELDLSLLWGASSVADEREPATE